MSRSTTYYIQECPTCGRSLHVRVEYLGKQVVCQHCHARFEAYDSANTPPPPSSSASGIGLMRRAEELLEESGLALHRRAEEQSQPAQQRRDARWH
jgi:hypothetical protein